MSRLPKDKEKARKKKLPIERADPKEFIDLANLCFHTLDSRQSNYRTWRNFYYMGSDTIVVPVNRVYGEVNNHLSMIFSPEQIILEGVPVGQSETEEDPEQVILDQICDVVKDNFFGNRLDVDTFNYLLSSLIDGTHLLKLHWSQSTHSVKFIGIQPDLFGVMYEALKIDDPAQIFCEKTELTEGQVKWYFSTIWPKLQQANAKETQQIDQSGAMKVVLGGPGSTQAQISVKETFDYTAKSAKPTYTQQTLWQFDNKEEQWRRTVLVGDQIAEDALMGLPMHFHYNLKPIPIPNYFWGLSIVYLLWKIQEQRNKFLTDPEVGMEKAIELLMDPPAVVSGFNLGFDSADKKWRDLRTHGKVVSVEGAGAKLEPYTPKMTIEDCFRYLDHLDGNQRFILGLMEILQGQSQKNVRGQGHSSLLAQFASTQVKRVAHTVEAQFEEIFTGCGMLYQINDGTQYQRTLEDKSKRTFSLYQYPREYRIEILAHTGSPITTEQNVNLLMALRKLGDIPRWILTHVLPLPFKSKIIAWIRKSEEAQAKEKEKQMELLEKSMQPGAQKPPTGMINKIFGGGKGKEG